jgi:hypothetical protein
VEIDTEGFFKFALVPRIVLSWIVVRKIGGRDIGDSLGVYSYNLGRNQPV